MTTKTTVSPDTASPIPHNIPLQRRLPRRGRSGAALCPSAASPSACTARWRGCSLFMTPIVGWSCSGSFCGQSPAFLHRILCRGQPRSQTDGRSRRFCGRRRPYRRQRPRVVQIERPAVLFLICQVRQPEVRRHFFEIFLVADRCTDRAAALGHEGRAEGELFVIFTRRIFSPRFHLGSSVSGWLSHQASYKSGRRSRVRSRLWAPRHSSIFCGRRSAARAARRGPPRPRGG
mgnify:CR=1 FL=1